jgi:hypothetical protein
MTGRNRILSEMNVFQGTIAGVKALSFDVNEN